MEGLRTDRCGSPSSSGCPDAVREPASATQLDPRPVASPRIVWRTARLGSSTGEPDRADELVGLEPGLAEHLRQPAPPGTAEQVELEQAVLGRGVALQVEEVVRGARVDVRDAPDVAHDLAACVQTEEPVVAVEGGLRAVHEEGERAGDREHDDEDERDHDGAPAVHVDRMTIRSAPPSTFVPSPTAICAIVLACAARSSFSIFI